MIRYESHNMDINDPFTTYEVTNLTWELHFHRAYECILVLEGEIHCKIENQEYFAHAGNLLFIMPNQLHSLMTPEYSHICILRFSPELVGHFHKKYFDKIPANSCIAPEDFLPIRTELTKEKLKNTYFIKALLYKICAEVLEQTAFVMRQASPEDMLIYHLLSYIDEHYMEECSLKSAAATCGCSYYHASKVFLKNTGISFVDYVNNLRIHKACYLITNSNESILSISLSCGFSSLRSFNRNFLKYCGCTPTDYRKK